MPVNSRGINRVNMPVLLMTFMCSSFLLGRQVHILFRPFLTISEDGNRQHQLVSNKPEKASRKITEKNYNLMLRSGEHPIQFSSKKKKRKVSVGATPTASDQTRHPTNTSTMKSSAETRNATRSADNHTLAAIEERFFARLSQRSFFSVPTHEASPLTSRRQSVNEPSVLPEFPWEVKAIETRTCDASKNQIPQRCCPGSFSAGGRLLFRPDVCDHSRKDYDKVRDYALQYLRTKFPSHLKDSCDVCRIVDHLFDHNLTLSFVGDSVTRQIGTGFECELYRRGYQVRSDRISWVKRRGCSSKQCIGEKVKFTISKPDSTETVEMYHYGVYRPDRSNADLKEEILPNSDIVIFDHGLHWKTQENETFYGAMKAYLSGFQNSNLTMLAWRETSAQHNDSPGGHYGLKKESDNCVPIKKGHEKGYRSAIMQQAAHDTGFEWKNIFDEGFSNRSQDGNELVFLPFREYTVPLHYMHPNECTHYCYTPYIWLPLWKSIRIAIDRAILNRNT